MSLYKKRNGSPLIPMIKKQVGLKGTGLDTFVLLMVLGAMALNANPQAIEATITDGGGLASIWK